jgi:uncharacterized membrane protein YkvA (DUF1232 family)
MSTDNDAHYLDLFPEWLRTLGVDLAIVVDTLGDTASPEAARKALAGSLNYVFKSIDLIPDGIEDIGYLDDAFVVRVAASQAIDAGLSGTAHPGLATLASDAEHVKAFLGAEYVRLDRYVQGLRGGAVRGRSVDDIVANTSVREELAADVRGFSRDYKTPAFTREERTLIKLRAFFEARLPR